MELRSPIPGFVAQPLLTGNVRASFEGLVREMGRRAALVVGRALEGTGSTAPAGSSAMKFCVFGAGAVGGFVGGQVAHAAGSTGAEVSLVARGPQLAAVRQNGLNIEAPDDTYTVRPAATDNPADLGVQDFVFLSAKAHALGAAAEAMQPLLGPDTVIVAAQNGIPFWYFHGHGGPYEGHVLQSVDPGGRIAAALASPLADGRVIGCVVNSSNEVVIPGTVRNLGNRVFMLGAPGGAPGRSPLP